MSEWQAARQKTDRPRQRTADRILEETLKLADEVGWDGVRLRVVAERLGLGLDDIRREYRDLDAIADAWFKRAHVTMLAAAPVADLPPVERIERILFAWFDALEPYRKVTGEMLAGKLYPSHPHHWVPLVFNLSRTIHWLRDAARLDAAGRRRQVEEIGLSMLFLATLRVWLSDDTPEHQRTRRFLRRWLDTADRILGRFFR